MLAPHFSISGKKPAMSTYRSIFKLVCAVAFTFAFGLSNAWGLGDEEFGNEPQNALNFKDWPGIMPVVNDANRVYRRWVNGNEQFFYKGDTAALNAALKNFAGLEVKTREVILRPGPGTTENFHRDKKVAFDWTLQVHGGISKHILTLDQGTKVWHEHPFMTIYVGGDIDLDKLVIPAGITVVDTAEVAKRVTEGLTTSKDKTVRGWGCGQLVSLDPYSSENLATIAKMLGDEDDWVKLNAVGCLATFGKKGEPFLPKLREFQESKDESLSSAAKRAIGEIEKAEDQTASEKSHREMLEKIHRFVANRKPCE